MELINVFLTADNGRVKLSIIGIDENDQCKNIRSINKIIKRIIRVIGEYIILQESVFYLVLKSKDIFIFKYNKGHISQVENNEFFVFDENLVFADTFNKITGIEFIITDSMPVMISPKKGISVNVSSFNKKYV
ncbi:virion core protein [White-tailed deer poxvirus]|nr:virion core protein [White-tailed deer poxvirus]